MSVALSTSEAEFIAASIAVQESIWFKRLLTELMITERLGCTLYCDNQGAIFMIKNNQSNKRAKHIDTRFMFIRDFYNKGLFDLKYVKSSDQLADGLTKPLSIQLFNIFKNFVISDNDIK